MTAKPSKTINIITRPNMRNGQFGKIFAGYGYEDKYQAGGNASLFAGKTTDLHNRAIQQC